MAAATKEKVSECLYDYVPSGEPEYGHHMGKRIAIYGPNYIWTGTLVGETANNLICHDVYQVFETGSHDQAGATGETFGKVMTFPKCAICNVGEPKWAVKK